MIARTKEGERYIILYLSGKVDVHTSFDIEIELDNFRIKYPNKDIILDMSQVDHLSSSGLKVLVALMKQLKEDNRKLKFCKLSKAVSKVFEVVELTDMFDIYTNETSAIKEKY